MSRAWTDDWNSPEDSAWDHDHVCDPEKPDCAAYLHYSDPENCQPKPGGLVVRRKRRPA